MEHKTSSLIDLDHQIQWNPCFHVELVEGAGIFLFSEKETLFLEGEIYLVLGPLLSEGIYSAQEIVSVLEKKVAAASVYYALSRLEKKNLIRACLKDLTDDIQSFAGHFPVSSCDLNRRLKDNKVHVEYLGIQEKDEFIKALKAMGLNITSNPQESSFSVLVVSDYLHPEIAAFNESSIECDRQWMLVKPIGCQIWLGPIFDPEDTGCWNCLTNRLKRHRLEEQFIAQKKQIDLFLPPTSVELPSVKKIAYHLAAIEVFKQVILKRNDQLHGKLITYDTITLKQQEHVLTKLPHCSCSAPADKRQLDAPPLLQQRKKEKNTGPGFRLVSAEETLKKFAHLISPITGVVGELSCSNQTNSSLIHVFQGGYNNALPKKSIPFKIDNFRSASAGKGTSDSEAKVGCLCESLERFSCVFQGDEPNISARYSDLKEQAVHPHSVLLFSEDQYQNRDSTNLLNGKFNHVCAPFPEDAQMHWTRLWSLSQKKYKYYPASCCYFEYPQDAKIWDGRADSNGCAAGNSLEEAILQGFFELVERDAVAIWWYNRLRKPQLDLKSFQNPYVDKLLDEYAKLGRECWVLDLTTDLGIPTFAAISRLTSGDCEKILFGFGTHLDAELALLRALTEMNQFLTSVLFWDDLPQNTSRDREEIWEWLHHCTIENQPYLKGRDLLFASHFPKWETNDLLEDIHHCQSIVDKLGMEFLIKDHTRKEIGLPVVRVIVPGLRHFWKRLAPGRLYEVPVKMGWLEKPLQESDMNPIAQFL
ncbi:MAG: TOMM precursor leader peptide-binding protein [Verrucomicrobia bacterium]|nr:TOMM precursor leader peptide-binding protein [Verrucomicrobiota bacterium]